MSELSYIALVSGCLLFGWHALLAARPGLVGAWMTGFPRGVWPGRVLAGAAVAWVAVLLLSSGIKWVESHQYLVFILAPAALLLIVVFVDELLAVRALGGLLLLVAQPILRAAFLHPSDARLVMSAFAYILVVLGIIWVWSPFMFRKMTAGWIFRPGRAAIAGAGGCLAGLIMIALALTVY